MDYARWLASSRGVEWTRPGADIRILLDRAHLRAYREAVLVRKEISRDTFARQCQLMAMLASPFAEATALRSGDVALADEMAANSTMLHSARTTDGEASWLTQLKREESDSIVGQREKARRIEAAWTCNGELAAYSYEQLLLVGEELIRSVEAYAQMPLHAQLRALTDGWQPDRTWANRVQDALFWQDQTYVPLRVSTACRIDLSERMHSSGYHHIHALIPKIKTKTPGNGDFDPTYAREAESPYSRELYALFVTEGGARDILRTDNAGVRRNLIPFYLRTSPKSLDGRMDYNTAYKLVRRCVERAEPALGGLTAKEILRGGGLGTHFFRHSYATYLVRLGYLEVASLYLHHADVEMIRSIYSANTAGSYDPGAIIALARRGVSGSGSEFSNAAAGRTCAL